MLLNYLQQWVTSKASYIESQKENNNKEGRE